MVNVLLLAMALSPAVSSTDVASANMRLGREGDVGAWLIAGPFPNEGALQLRGTGYATDYLKPEATATPVEGQAVPPTSDGKAKPWRLALVRGPQGIDLREEFSNYFPGIAYAYVGIVSERNQPAVLRFGSDDGGKVWINGVQKYGKQVARGVTRDEERIDLDLNEGLNHILFKIEQGDGGWGLTARLTQPDGAPLENVKARLQIERTPSEKMDAESFVRQSAGGAGTLDVEAAIRYFATARHARFWINRFRKDAKDPKQVDDALLRSEESVRKARRDADRLSSELNLAVTRIDTAYRDARRPWLESVQNPGPLFRTDVSREDFVRVMPGGRFFVHSNGKPFTPIGYNHNPDWPRLMAANPQVPEEGNFDAKAYDPKVTDDWFAHLAKKGINLVRLMVETPPSGNMEDPVGTIQPEHARWLDHVFTSARKHRVKLMVTPYDTFWMNLRWETTTYSPLRGGPIQNKIDWYLKPELREAQKRRMRWLIDRYGNLGTVFSWEIMNEADIWWGASPEQLQEWANEMVPWVRQYQVQKWGRSPLITISTAEAMPKNVLSEFAFRRKDLDFATTHLYIEESKAPTEPYAVIRNMEQGVRHALAEIRDNRPFFDGENGPIDRWIADAALDEEVFHNQSWAHLAAGGAGSSLRWPYRNPHHLTEGMLDHLQRMRKFTDAVDWSKLNGPLRPSGLTLPPGIAGTSFATDKGGIVFVTRTGADLSGDLAIPMSIPGRLRAFDTRTGRWLTPRAVIPHGIRSVAFVATK